MYKFEDLFCNTCHKCIIALICTKFLIPLLVDCKRLFLLHSSFCHSEMAYPVCEAMQDSETLLMSFP
jgi:hypothetical protein